MKKIAVLLALLLVPVVYAQLDWSITDLRCGNGVLDQLELCEKGVEKNICHELGANLSIAMECFEKHCTCVPKVNLVYCGNKRRDLNEMCDAGSAEDKCPVLGGLMGNITLKCNTKTCGCDIVTIPSDYSPAIVAQYVNATQTASVCGNKKVERAEDCDPPNTLCTLGTKDAGVCNDKCECVKPELLGAEEPKVEPVAEANVTETAAINTTENVSEKIPEASKEPGFFARIWAWLAGLFS